MTAIEWLSWSALAVNLALTVYNWRQFRRWRMLNRLLAKICADAFLSRHLPIWAPWSALSGMKIELSLKERKEERP